MDSPTREQIKTKRKSAKLTQTQSASLIYITPRGWQHFEAGTRKMHPAFWELFNIKIKDKAAGDE